MLNNTTAGRKTKKNTTHLAFSDTFNLSHVSKSASVIAERVMKLGASRWGAALPWILRWARSSLYRSGTFLSPSSTGSLSWARITQVTIDFSSVWPWFLSIWSRSPHHRGNQVQGRGPNKQKVRHGNSKAEDRANALKHLSLSRKYGLNQSCDYFYLHCPLNTAVSDTVSSSRWQSLV